MKAAGYLRTMCTDYVPCPVLSLVMQSPLPPFNPDTAITQLSLVPFRCPVTRCSVSSSPSLSLPLPLALQFLNKQVALHFCQLINFFRVKAKPLKVTRHALYVM